MIPPKICSIILFSTLAGCDSERNSVMVESLPEPTEASDPRYFPTFVVNGLPAPFSNVSSLSLVLPSEGAPLLLKEAKVRFLRADGAAATCESPGTLSPWVAVGDIASLDLGEDGEKRVCVQLMSKDGNVIPNKFSHRWAKDTVAPTLSFKEAPSLFLGSESVSLWLKSSKESVRYVFIQKTSPQSLTAEECQQIPLAEFGNAFDLLSEPLKIAGLAKNGATSICARGVDAAGNNSAPLFADFKFVNTPPSSPALVILTPNSPTKSSTLTCTPTSGGADPDGDVVSPVYYWYRNGIHISGATASTLAMNSNVGFVKGDGFRCDVAYGDGTALTAPVASGVVTLLNSAPTLPTSVTVTAGAPTKEGSFSCGYTGGSDVDGDTMSPTYAWAVDGSVIFGQTSSTLLGSVAAVVKSKVVACAVTLGDGTATSSATSSAGTTVLNSPVAGTVTCTGAAPHAIGKTGGSYSIACSGATDSDGTSDFTYQLEAVTGTCPSIASNGILAGAFPTAGNCEYKVKACDSLGCTAFSNAYRFSSYTLTAGLAAPTLASDCTLSFAGSSTPSGNLSDLIYSGSTGLSGTTVNSSGLSLVLEQGTHSAGSYQANWGVTSADIFGFSASNSVTASASPVNFALTLADPAAWAMRTPAATLAGNAQVGRQVPAASPGASKCVSNASGNYAMIAAGLEHTCALTSTGAVKCWGGNDAGQLGDNSATSRSTPVDVNGLSSGVTAIATGTFHTCALTSGGAVKCWGDNGGGQLGDNSSTERSTPVGVSGLSSGVTAITAGDYHTCALTSGGAVKCWGSNSFGELGDTSLTQRLIPTDVSGLSSGVIAIAAGMSHTCALTNAGAVKCWGSNSSGQLGDSSTSPRNIPVAVSGLSSGVMAIAAGSSFTCALTISGGIKCWGDNAFGQLGDNSTTPRNTPVNVSGLSTNVITIAAGGGHTCALTSAGAVKCWGSNANAQLGDNSKTNRSAPVDVSGLSSGVVALTAGNVHTCAVTSSGAVKCWGFSASISRLGAGFSTLSKTPVDVSGLSSGVTAIANGYGNSCSLTNAGAVKCWGGNETGQLGDNSTTQRNTFVDVSGLSSGVTAVAVGGFHACGLTSSGAVKCWGSNSSGQVGDTSLTQRLTPTDVSGFSSGSTAIAAGYSHTCALTDAGAVKCWGANASGQLGDSSTTQRNAPVDVSGLTTGVTKIAAGGLHSCARTSAGAVKCWGGNINGQLGDNSTTQRNTPADVSGLSSGVTAIATGYSHTCALTSVGAVKCWGANSSGQLGDNSATQRNTPVDVSGLSSGVTAIAAGGMHTCALLSSGAVKCWGDNSRGQVGDNSTTRRDIPADVSGLSSGVTSISAGSNHTCAITGSGAAKCWGLNYHGQLGNISIPNHLSIVDVIGLSGIGLIQKIFSL